MYLIPSPAIDSILAPVRQLLEHSVVIPIDRADEEPG